MELRSPSAWVIVIPLTLRFQERFRNASATLPQSWIDVTPPCTQGDCNVSCRRPRGFAVHSAFGLKSRPAASWPTAWRPPDPGVEGRFVEVVGKAVLPCCHACQSIPQLRMCGTESHRRRTQEMHEPNALGRPCCGKFMRRVEGLEARAGAVERSARGECGRLRARWAIPNVTAAGCCTGCGGRRCAWKRRPTWWPPARSPHQ